MAGTRFTLPLKMLTSVAVLGLVAACGGDDGADLSDDQQFIVDDVQSTMQEFGVGMDEDCVSELAAQMPDEDARLYVESEGEADGFSAEAEALGEQIQGCVDDVSGLIDQLVAEAEASDFFDADCAREAYESATPADVMASLGGDGPIDLEACFTE